MFVIFLALTTVFLAVVLSGWFSGSRMAIAPFALGALICVDLARANSPWVLHFNWRERYSSNPLIETLKRAPHEGRVTGQMPFGLGGEADRLQRTISSVYGGEWLQHQFPYYDIQSLEVSQLPRPPADYVAYKTALRTNPIREWELTNTRYLLSLAPLVPLMNKELDGGQNRFQLNLAFGLQQTQSGAIQVVTNQAGPFGLIEFTGTLPRAMLFDSWRGSVADEDALSTLASTNFNPRSQVLVAEQVPAPSVNTTTQPAGSATYRRYTSTESVIETESRTPCVLLVNDRYDSKWTVLVNGKEEPLLRANYLMRGVYLPAGKHTVEFRFQPPLTTLWISLAAWIAVAAAGWIAWRQERAAP